MKNKRNYDSKDALKLIAELISKGQPNIEDAASGME